jgi:DNA-binding response OmpR family regulator
MEEDLKHESKKLKILIVDDDPQIRRLIKLLLDKRFSFIILEAGDGRQALSLIEKENPFMVILDIMMPGIDGIETLRIIREKEEWKKLPVIICSAVNEREKILLLYNQGIVDYIIKPINPTVFGNKITNYLKMHLSQALESMYFKA